MAYLCAFFGVWGRTSYLKYDWLVFAKITQPNASKASEGVSNMFTYLVYPKVSLDNLFIFSYQKGENG